MVGSPEIIVPQHVEIFCHHLSSWDKRPVLKVTTVSYLPVPILPCSMFVDWLSDPPINKIFYTTLVIVSYFYAKIFH